MGLLWLTKKSEERRPGKGSGVSPGRAATALCSLAASPVGTLRVQEMPCLWGEVCMPLRGGACAATLIFVFVLVWGGGRARDFKGGSLGRS